MARERTVVKGIVLRAVDTKESDKILTILTPHGKLPVVAKGARSRRSRVTACTQLLAYSEFTLSESRGWQYLAEGSTLELFDGVRQDIELLSLASYFAELTEAAALENTESGPVLSLLLNALYALGTLKKPQALVKAAFELKLMALIGFEPLADGCAFCGNPEPKDPVLDVREGVVCCKACGKGERGLSMPLSPGALTALRRVLYGEAKRLYSFSLAEPDLKKLGDASEAYIHTVLERGFGTLDFYKTLLR
ncbi:MAG: DNA repair protein RecO [Oscillospiraceae bacterium]|nr:DNA repair protein RecO [Oscillospiraceae bacterium]